MKINLFIIDNSVQNYLITFFTSIKKIKLVFQNISLLKNCKNENNLILIPPETKKNYILKSINKFQLFKLKNICYLVPIAYSSDVKSSKIQSIFYPIKIDHFENQLTDLFFKTKYSYKNFSLIDNMNYTWRAIFIVFLLSGIGRSIATIPFLRLKMPKKYPGSIHFVDRLMEFRMFRRR